MGHGAGKVSRTLGRSAVFVFTLCSLLFALCPSSQAQPAKKMPRIGWLSAGSSASEFPEKQVLEGLHALGWVDGKNALIEFRHARGDAERLARFAAELVRLNVDLIVTFSAGVGIAKRATSTVPIVAQTSQDPVRAGFVASLARPGGNITGVTFLNDELSGKRLELLKEAMPELSRALILWEPAHVDNEFKGMQSAAPRLGVRLHSAEVPRPARPDEVERAISAAAETETLIVAPGGFTIANRKRLIDEAMKRRLPVSSAWRIFADDGAFLTYGPDISTIARRLAVHVDKILKGAKPANLPVEQPTKFEMVINLKSANQIGLAIPANVLARADRVIR
jgi:putative ABC transport system substrate-binding protein